MFVEANSIESIIVNIDGLIEVAARARVEGKEWEEIAQLVGRAMDTVEAWKRKRPTDWAAAVVKAIDDRLPEIESQAINALLAQVVKGTKAEKAWAAKELALHCRQLRGTRMRLEHSGPKGGPIEHFLTLPDEELDVIADTDKHE